jgi:putative transposase
VVAETPRLYRLELETIFAEDEELDMPKKQHSEVQIIGGLRQYEAGAKTGEVCRKMGISRTTFYRWKRQYAGLGVQERPVLKLNGSGRRILFGSEQAVNRID